MTNDDYTHGPGCDGDCDAVEPTPECIEGYQHRWTGEGLGGVDENPGVWYSGHSGTSITIRRRCVVCGMHRRELYYGSQRNAYDCDQRRYERDASAIDDDESSAERERQDTQRCASDHVIR